MFTGVNQIDFLFNILVMLFWIQAWDPKPLSLIPNTYATFVENLTNPVLGLLRPVTGGKTAAALFVFTVLIVFRALAFPTPAQPDESINWTIQLGFNTLSPAAFTPGARIIFSAMSFIVFLFHIWAFELIVCLAYKRQQPDDNPVGEFVYRLAYPFSIIKTWTKIAALPALGVAIVILMDSIATQGGAHGFSFSSMALRRFISALAGIINALQLTIQIMIGMIIASWIGLLANSAPVMSASREWIDFIIGPVVRKFRLQIGMFDLTPLLVLLGLDFIHRIIIVLLFIPYRIIQ